MFALAMPVIRYLGFGGCIAVGLVIFYEGLPLGPLRYIPWVGPQLEQLVDGRVDREYRRGAADERLVWQKRQQEADAKHVADVKAKQAEIDQITLDYLNTKAAQRAAQTALDAAIAKAEEEYNAAPSAAPVCRRFIPRGVSNELNRIR